MTSPNERDEVLEAYLKAKALRQKTPLLAWSGEGELREMARRARALDSSEDAKALGAAGESAVALEAVRHVLFMESVGINPFSSAAEQLEKARELVQDSRVLARALRDLEARLEGWETAKAPNGPKFVVHQGGKS